MQLYSFFLFVIHKSPLHIMIHDKSTNVNHYCVCHCLLLYTNKMNEIKIH